MRTVPWKKPLPLRNYSDFRIQRSSSSQNFYTYSITLCLRRLSVIAMPSLLLLATFALTVLYGHVANAGPLIFNQVHTLAPTASTRALQVDITSPTSSQSSTQKLPSRKRLPSALIIGVRKGGTRALIDYLDLHPNISSCGPEVHFFDDEANYAKGIDWYREQMPDVDDHHIVMEKTPGYFVSSVAPERVYALNASMRLIFIVRDPVHRTVSDYLQIRENKLTQGVPFPSFEDFAINKDTGQVNTAWRPVRTSIYHRHFERWIQFFPREQIHIVDGDSLVADPVPEIQRVEKFLKLPPRISSDDVYFNSTRGFYCMRKSESEKYCLGVSKGRKHPSISADVIARLRTFFRSHNAKFFQMIGYDFPWL